MDHHVDAVVGDAEQLVGLDHLEALVHEGGRVDGDLRAHLPGRVGQGVVHADRGQLVPAATAERAARGRDQQAGHRQSPGRRRPSSVAVARRRCRHWWMAQCSESTGTISAPGVRRARCTTGAPAMSDSLLARARRRPASSAARVTGSPAKPTTPLTTTRPPSRRPASPSGPATHLDPRRQPAGQVGGQGRVADGHHLGTEPRRPGRPAVHRALGGQGHHLEPVGLGRHHLERLGADRAGRPDQADRLHAHRSPSPCSDARLSMPSAWLARQGLTPGRHPRWKALTR